jgi:hypothetical protein
VWILKCSEEKPYTESPLTNISGRSLIRLDLIQERSPLMVTCRKKKLLRHQAAAVSPSKNRASEATAPWSLLPWDSPPPCAAWWNSPAAAPARPCESPPAPDSSGAVRARRRAQKTAEFQEHNNEEGKEDYPNSRVRCMAELSADFGEFS